MDKDTKQFLILKWQNTFNWKHKDILQIFGPKLQMGWALFLGAGVWSCGPKAVEGTGFILKQVSPPTSVSVLRGTTSRSAATFWQYRRRGLMNFTPIWKGKFYFSTRWETVFELHFGQRGWGYQLFFSFTIWYIHNIFSQIVYVQFKSSDNPEINRFSTLWNRSVYVIPTTKQ